MGLREVLLFLIVLAGWGYSDARSLTISHVSVMHINYEDPRSKTPELNVENERLCTLCEQFVAQAIYYLGENKTQTEVIESLHQACSRLHNFYEECHSLVDYYAPLFFIEIAMIQPEDFCKKVNLCEGAGFISPVTYGDRCAVCHQAVVEVLMKLKDPDTQLEIIGQLIKGCDKVESYVKQCKKLVFEYGSLILANTQKFLETHDICTSIHVCKDSGTEYDATMPVLERTSAEFEVGSEDS